MRQIYPDLWVTEPEHLAPELPDLTLYDFLLVRETGNVLFCRSEHLADHQHIKELGGITHQYLTHWHEAAPGLARVKKIFGSKLTSHWLAEAAVSKFRSVDVTFERRGVHLGDIEVIPSPGHTLGARAFASSRPMEGRIFLRAIRSSRAEARGKRSHSRTGISPPEAKPRDAAQRGRGRDPMRRLSCRRPNQGDFSGRVACRPGTSGSVLARRHNREPACIGSGSVTEILVLYYSSYGRIENMASADLVSFATPCVANIDLAERLRFGAPLAEYEPTTFYDGDHRRYPDYPSWYWMA